MLKVKLIFKLWITRLTCFKFMMKAHFLRTCAYNHAANMRTVASIQSAVNLTTDLDRLFSHIINAQEIWLDRLQSVDESSGPSVWNLHAIHEFGSRENKNFSRFISYLDSASEDEWERVVRYKNTQGVEFENTVSDILLHVFNHSTYHRAQIAFILRQLDEKPVNTDFIAFARGVFS